MANPYPPQMQPMMQPPGPHGHGQPMMQMNTPPPGAVRRGTSRAVPVVVSAGLAIGVFCGLLFGLGTGDEVIASASAKPTEVTEEKIPVPPRVGEAAPGTTTPEPTPAAGSGTQVAAAPAAGSAAAPPAEGSAAPAEGSAAPSAGSAAEPPPAAGSGATPPPAAPVAKVYKVKFKFLPDALAESAKVTIDGKAIEGNEADIDLGTAEKKEIKVVVKANGYRTYEQKLTVEADMNVQVEMIKRPVSAPTGPRPGGTGTGGTKKPPGGGGGGLIDI